MYVVDQVLFPIFAMSIRSGNIRDKSRKLSKIAPNFGHLELCKIERCKV